jgi:hypothetical protein
MLLVTSPDTAGLRTLTFAYKDLSKETFEARGANTDFVESSLIFMGIVGIKDPVRPEVVVISLVYGLLVFSRERLYITLPVERHQAVPESRYCRTNGHWRQRPHWLLLLSAFQNLHTPNPFPSMHYC